MTRRLLRDVAAAYVNSVKDFLSPYDAAREASLVIEHLTGLSRSQQIVSGRNPFDGSQAVFDGIVTARLRRQPLSQIFGQAPFRDRMFRITPDVLSPRADTETLIDAGLTVRFRRLLDLGAGPGTVALTFLAECSEATAMASDVSQAALDVASQNAKSLGVADRVTFVQSDWLQKITGIFDLIVSNPPYVTAQAYADLAPEITQWEPRIALTPGGDGLSAYRVIARDAPAHLARDGHLMVEIGHDQARAVAGIFQSAGLQDLRILPDMNGKDRVVTARKP